MLQDQEYFSGNISLFPENKICNKELAPKDGLLDGKQTVSNNNQMENFSTLYKNGINVGVFEAYKFDRESPIYSITPNKYNYILKINNYSFRENELITYINSNKIDILNNLFSKFEMNFSISLLLKII